MKQLLKRTLSILLAAAMTVSVGITKAMAEDSYATRGEVCEMLLTAADDYNPTVQKSDILKGYEDRCVNIDNKGAMYKEIKYLIKNGHKKIAFINSSFDIIDAHQRKEGYLEAMKAHHLEVNEELMLSVPPSLEGGAQAAEKLLQVLKKDKNAFTAIACYSDTIAASAMSIFENRGIKVPEEVSFTGFDDLFLSSCLSPALTTVRNPIDDMGKNALLLSLDRASGENKFKISPFKTELIVRKSVTDLSKRSQYQDNNLQTYKQIVKDCQ